METNLPNPMTARVKLLIYQRVNVMTASLGCLKAFETFVLMSPGRKMMPTKINQFNVANPSSLFL